MHMHAVNVDKAEAAILEDMEGKTVDQESESSCHTELCQSRW